jgi:hypothetical protein
MDCLNGGKLAGSLVILTCMNSVFDIQTQENSESDDVNSTLYNGP